MENKDINLDTFVHTTYVRTYSEYCLWCYWTNQFSGSISMCFGKRSI